jgi:hypothetical protein
MSLYTSDSYVWLSEILINSLSLCSEDLLEEVTVAKLIKKFPTFYQPKQQEKKNHSISKENAMK